MLLSCRKFLQISITLSLLGLSACISESAPSPGQYCEVPEEQWDSFMPRMNWNKDRPVRVSIDPRFANSGSNHLVSIERALDAWNSFGSHSLRGKLFEYATAPVAANAGPASASDSNCDSFVGGSNAAFAIVREDSQERWAGLGLQKNVPAVTARCYSNGNLEKQVILINTKYADSQQFMGIALHELGHAVGLGHSCNTDEGTPHYIGCKDISESHPFYAAIMYPVFRVGSASDVKRGLRTNDMLRAHCLYSYK